MFILLCRYHSEWRIPFRNA